MFSRIPRGYRVVFVLSTIAAILAIPTMVLVISDFVYQMNWRKADDEAVKEARRHHIEQLAAQEKTRRACTIGHVGL